MFHVAILKFVFRRQGPEIRGCVGLFCTGLGRAYRRGVSSFIGSSRRQRTRGRLGNAGRGYFRFCLASCFFVVELYLSRSVGRRFYYGAANFHVNQCVVTMD